LGLVSRSYNVSTAESARILGASNAFSGPPQMLDPQIEIEDLQGRIVQLYRRSIELGESLDGADDFWENPGTPFLGRAVCSAQEMADVLGNRMSSGFSESRGSKSKVSFRILWSLSGSPSVLIFENKSGVETRRIRLDRQPAQDFALLSMPPLSMTRPWTGKVIAFASEQSAMSLWTWMSGYCSRSEIPMIAVHSSLGSPERTGRFGEVDLIVEGAASSVAGALFEGGLSSDVRVVRLAENSRLGASAADILKMETGGNWRMNLLRPLDDMISLISNLCSEDALSMAERSLGSVVSSGLVTARQRCEFLSRVSLFGSPGSTERMVEVAMSTPVSAPGFVLIPTPSGYLKRSTLPKAEPDFLVTDFRILPSCTVSGPMGGSSIVKVVSVDGGEFFVPVNLSAGGKPSKFIEEIRSRGAAAGISISISDAKSARALFDAISLGGMGTPTEIDPSLGFCGGDFISPVSVVPAALPSAPSLVDWISSTSGIGVPDYGWRETLSSLIQEDLSRPVDASSAGPAIALALAMDFLRSCSESGGPVTMVLSDDKLLSMISSVSGIKYASREWVSNLDKFPFNMSKLPMCKKKGFKTNSRNLPKFVITSEMEAEGIIDGPGIVSMFAATGFDLMIPRPDLVEISSVSASGNDLGSAMAAMLSIPREMVSLCREACSVAAKARGEGIPGFAKAFLEFAGSERFASFVMGDHGKDAILVDRDAIRAACLEYGIRPPSVSRALSVLRTAGICLGESRVRIGGNDRERLLIIPVNLFKSDNIVAIGATA